MEIVTPSLSYVLLDDGRARLSTADGAWEVVLTAPAVTIGQPGRRASTVLRNARSSAGGLHLRYDTVEAVDLELRVTALDGDLLHVHATLVNRTGGPLRILAVHPVVSDPTAGGNLAGTGAGLNFLRQGWQSWSHTGAHDLPRWRDAPSRIKIPFIRGMKENPATPSEDERWTSEMVTLLETRTGHLLVGLHPVTDRFSDVEVRRPSAGWHLETRIHLDGRRVGPGGRFDAGGVLLGAGASPDRLLAAWADRTTPRARTGLTRRETIRSTVGWCTWYCFKRRVTEGILKEVTDHIAARPGLEAIRLIQIDDVYQRRIGDWLTPSRRFPSGLAEAVARILERGFDAGVWVSPFIAEPGSELFRAHPDWFVRGRTGHPISGGWNPAWRTRFHALDTTLPAVRTWLRDLFGRLREMGLGFFKLDYLFPAALPGLRADPDVTRAGAMRLGLGAIRDAVGEDALLLGCGAPLGPAAGLVDAMRVSPDVAPFWRMGGIVPRILGEDELHGRAVSIRQSMVRAFLHDRWWINDPDVLLLGDDAPIDEIRCQAAAVAATGGLVLLGDDPRTLDDGRLEVFRWILEHRNQAGDCPDVNRPEGPTQVNARGGEGLSVEVDWTARKATPSVPFP